MPCGRASSGYKNPNGGRGSPPLSQKRPGGYAVALAAVASMASRDAVIFRADSTLTDRHYVIYGGGFLTTVIASIIHRQYLGA